MLPEMQKNFEFVKKKYQLYRKIPFIKKNLELSQK